MGMLANWLDTLTGRKSLKLKNDKLIAQNNRLGREILELRKAVMRKPKKPSADKIYMYHVQAQRQHLLVKALSAKMDRMAFLEECERINGMSDQQVLACGS